MSRHSGKRHREPTPMIWFAGDFQRAIMRLYQLFYDRETNSRTFRSDGTRRSPETLEDVREVLRLNPNSAVAHHESGLHRHCRGDLSRDVTARRRELRRVGQKIRGDLTE